MKSQDLTTNSGNKASPPAAKSHLKLWGGASGQNWPFLAAIVMRVLVYIILASGAIITLYPFWFMVSASFKTQAEIFSLPPSLFPVALRIENYVQLITQKPFLRWFANSTIVTTVRLVVSLFLCSLAGFAFAKYEFRLRRPLFLLVIASMMLPFEVIYIPLFIVMVRLGWVNSFQALITPWAASAFGIFLMRQFMVTIPDDLIDAARVDGASGFRIYWQIVVPLSRPAFGALAIVLYLVTWTSFSWPLIILTRPEMFTLPLGLASLLSSLDQQQYWETSMAAATLAAVPLILIFVLMQRQFIEGLSTGGLKG